MNAMMFKMFSVLEESIYVHFGFVEEWRKYPIAVSDDHWTLAGDVVYSAETREALEYGLREECVFEPDEDDEEGDDRFQTRLGDAAPVYYESEVVRVYRRRCFDVHVTPDGDTIGERLSAQIPEMLTGDRPIALLSDGRK